MELPISLRNKIIQFLTALPNINDPNSLRALIHGAGLDDRLKSEIHFGGSSQQFFQLLIPTLRNYGKLADERDPLEAVLETAKASVGSDKQTACDQLIEELRAFLEARQHIQRSNPYRGLFAFREEDERFFFGRETYTQKVLEAVQSTPLVAIIGASGSGKSSLMYAGLIPALRRQGTWLITAFRPRNDLFAELAGALIELWEPLLDKIDKTEKREKLLRKLSSGDLTLPSVVASILQDYPEQRLLLFADQFEEAYSPTNITNRQRFLDGLLQTCKLSRTSKISLVFTLRADFLGKALAYRPFADALQGADIIIAPMNREELRAAVEEPARVQNIRIEDGLTERILDAVGDEPGNLPLLEFALTELWKTQTNGVLTHAAYEAIGGVEQALVSYAERAYIKLSEDEQVRAQRIFTQLVLPGEGTEDIRRIATQADIGEDNWELITRLADERLVVTGGTQETGKTVEVVHEALIQRWQRLREWMDADREFRMWQEKLRAMMPESSDYTDDVLLRGVLLNTAEEWLKNRREKLTDAEQQFIDASLRLRDRETTEREARQQHELNMARKLAEEQSQRAEEQTQSARKLRRLLTVAIITAVFTVATSLIAWYGFQRASFHEQQAREQAEIAQTNEALARENQKRAEEAAVALQQETEKVKQERDQKEAERNNALRTQSLFLADLARQQSEHGYGTCAILLALEALPQDMVFPNRPYVYEAEVQLYHALNNQRECLILQHEGGVKHATFSPDGTKVVTASSDGIVRLWETNKDKKLTVLRGHESHVFHAIFSPDGTRIVTASYDNTVRVWEISSGQELVVLREHESSIFDVAFSPDGTKVVTALHDGTARVWEISSGQELAVLPGHESSVFKVAFSPDGTKIVTASDDGTARVWETASGQELVVLRGHESSLWHAAFSPDGTKIVTASHDGTARVWETASGQELVVLRGHKFEVKHVAFSPDGSRIVTASYDNTARVWETSNGRELTVLRGHENDIFRAIFNSDGTQIATASRDGTARIWEASSGQELIVLRGHGDLIFHIAFSPDDKRILTVSGDRTVRVWEIKRKTLLHGHEDYVEHATFSPDGTRIVTASRDGTARVWETTGGQEMSVFNGHENRVVHAAFSPDGTQVVTASHDHTAQVWNVRNGKKQVVLSGHKDLVAHAAFSPDGTRIVTASSDHTARVWEVASGQELAVLRGHKLQVDHAEFSPNGTYILTASMDTARVWEAATGQELAVLDNREGGVAYATFSPDGTRIVTASWDGTSLIWTADSGKKVVSLLGHTNAVVYTAFSPDGKQIATASLDGTVRLWEVTSGQEIMVLRKHKDAVYRLAFSPDGRQIATASSDGTVRLWGVADGQEQMILPKNESGVYYVTFNPNGSQIVTISSDGATVRIWQIFPSTQALIDYARATLPRQELTDEEKQQFFLAD